MATNLVTLSEYKAYMGINQPNDDTRLQSIIDKCSAFVKSYCKNTFVDYVNDSKVDYSNGGDHIIYLSEIPLISLISFEYSSDYGNTYTELVEFTDYIINQEDACLQSLLSESGFPRLINGYKITYSAGYETVPEDLKVAVMDLITYYHKNDTAVHSPKAPGTNTVQIEYINTGGMPSHISRVLNLYKKDFA